MKYKDSILEFVKNIGQDSKVVDFLLFGEIGRQVDGNAFAHEMSMFGDFEEIRINVNSVGGSIIHGNSIMGAMAIARTKGVKITTINRGVADSMAGMILANGDKGSRIAMDFSTALVHEPLIVDQKTGNLVKIKDLQDKDLKDELLMFKESLLVGLSANTGKSKEELDVIMSSDTRLDAKGMRDTGFVDSIELSNNKPNIKNSMTAVELMAACSNYNNQKPKQMNLVTSILNLNEDAKEESIVAGIKDLQSKSDRVDDLEKDIKNLKDDAVKNEKEIEGLKEEVKESQEKEVEAIVDTYIEKGIFSADKRESLIVNASKNIESFKEIADSMKPARVDVIGMINKSTEGTKDKELDMAKAYRAEDMKDGGILAFKNKVGEEKFISYETAYENRLNEL